MCAATELAGIIINDAPAPVGNIADNNDNDEQLIDAAPVENIGNHTSNNDPHYVVDEQSNDAAAPICNVAGGIDNNEQQISAAPVDNGIINNVEAAPVHNIPGNIDNNEQLNDAAPVENIGNHAINNDRHEVADGQLIEAVVGNENIETHYAAIHKDGTTLTVPTIKYLNDQLELRDRRMCDLEAKHVDLESKMTALSDTVGDWKCTSIDSRFSHMTDFSLGVGLNFVGQGGGRGDEEVGDEEKDSGSGDQN